MGTHTFFSKTVRIAHTVNNSVPCLENACSDRIIVGGMYPPHVNCGIFASGACLEIQEYSNNSRTEDSL